MGLSVQYSFAVHNKITLDKLSAEIFRLDFSLTESAFISGVGGTLGSDLEQRM